MSARDEAVQIVARVASDQLQEEFLMFDNLTENQKQMIAYSRNEAVRVSVALIKDGQPQRAYRTMLGSLHEQARYAGLMTSAVNPVTGRPKGIAQFPYGNSRKEVKK